MIAFYITIPLMVLAVAVAVLPLLLSSVRHHRAMLQRRLETPQSVAQEANFWHHMLGHCTAEDFVLTPDFVADSEVPGARPMPRDIDLGQRAAPAELIRRLGSGYREEIVAQIFHSGAWRARFRDVAKE